MKKQKIVRPFFFTNMIKEDVVNILNRDIKINLKHNEDLIDRICSKYPLISKTEVSIIVTAVFQSFRDFLVLGKVLNFNKLFFDTKLYFFDYRKNGRILPSLKVKISTPPTIK